MDFVLKFLKTAYFKRFFVRKHKCMMLKHCKHITQSIELPYYLSGEKPRLLITAGIHGDEYESIEFVKKAIERHCADLPPLLFIPAVSPSAIAQKTRHNSENHDVNRHFYANSPSAEAQAVQGLLTQYRFLHTISFHEDPAQDKFYLYDSGLLANFRNFSEFKSQIANLGVSLLNGIDDPEDPLLGHSVNDGYVSIPPGKFLENSGPFETWLINNAISQQVIAPEIPGKLSRPLKQKVVDCFFRDIIVPLTNCKI